MALATAEEYKRVTVLCCTVGEAPALALRLGPEAMHQVMQGVVARAEEVIRRYEGTLVHVTGDGFTALFGAPVAQEDHATACGLAALELRQYLHSQPLLRVLTRAKPYRPASGCTLDQQWWAISARTATALHRRGCQYPSGYPPPAPGTTRDHPHQRCDLPASAGRGRRRGVGRSMVTWDRPWYRCTRCRGLSSGVRACPGGASHPVSRFVGRRRELMFLHKRLAQAAQGRGRWSASSGNPAWASRVCSPNSPRACAAKPLVHCEGQCLAYGRTTPYLLVCDLLRQM